MSAKNERKIRQETRRATNARIVPAMIDAHLAINRLPFFDRLKYAFRAVMGRLG